MVRTGRLMLVGALCVAASACVQVQDTHPNRAVVDPTIPDDLDLYYVDYPAVREMSPQGAPFTQGLRAGYITYSDDLIERNGRGDGIHFARKAVASAKGLNVQPDALAYRPRLAADYVDELTIARARLMAALDANGRRTAPDPASRAQVAYDCWLREQSVNDAEGVARCKAEFEQAIGEVERALGPGLAETYIVFFAWDRSDITPVAQEILQQVVEDFRRGTPTRLVLAGHADTSGPAPYNLQLSERRARSVAAALTQLGIPADDLEVTWYGETQPRVPTGDGVREPQNRRVEITFGD
jgi:OmpA-OmpF porin, OOP family